MDSLITGDPQAFLYKSDKFFALLKILPFPMLLSSSPEKLLAWANSSAFYKIHNRIGNEKIGKIFSLTLAVLDDMILKDAELKVCEPRLQEIRDKLCLEKNLVALNYKGRVTIEKNIAQIESSGLSGSLLKQMDVIQILIKELLLPANYIDKRIALEEKELLNNSLDVSENTSDVKSKRRI